MQSFGDATLSACMKIDSDLANYFKDSKRLPESYSKSDVHHELAPHGREAASYAFDKARNTSKGNGSNLDKYFDDSIAFPSIESENADKKYDTQPRTANRSTNKRLQGNISTKTVVEETDGYVQGERTPAANPRATIVVDTAKNVANDKEINVKLSPCRVERTADNVHDDESKSCTSLNNGSSTCTSIEIPSIIRTQDRCKLASWGLPPNILEKYKARGISGMFPWQVECLSNHELIEEYKNLVYSAPTSAGKTLIAEILLIKTLLERRKKAIFILPFVSVVREKMYYFQDLLSDSGAKVAGFMGSTAPPGGFAATHLAVATIEKANSIVNRLMEEGELNALGAVVIDELHLIGDPNRGYLLELLLTKLKYMTLRDDNINIQLIGMSATLPNLPLLAKWLDAELYKTDFRPVPLNEQCKIGGNIYDSKLNLIRSMEKLSDLPKDTDDILQLCIETISNGHSVLIFCPTKSWCETLARQIAVAFLGTGQKHTSLGETLRQQLNATAILETLEQLRRSPVGLDNTLRNTVSLGVAFHHAGLTMDERDIIEGSFRSGSLRVLTATSTLSSGVNLPARRVIIRSPMFGGKVLDALTYRQMIGRAGRMGRDTAGESILICKPSERSAAETLLSARLDPIESCLEGSGPLIRALLEAVASEVVYTPADLELYTKCTLVSLSEEYGQDNPVADAMKFLVENEFLLLQTTAEDETRWVATPLGKACLAASLPPREGLFLFEELQRARRCFVLDTELHVIYLVTPVSSGSQIGTIDWMGFMEQWKTISESERRVGQLVGVDERYLMSAIRGVVRPGKLLNIHKRFYTAMALHDLVREVPLNTVCKKYGCCRGVLQSLQQSAATFAGMVTQFCKQLGWDCMELLVSQFQTRLQFGVCRELLDLLRLPMLNGLRARSLYKHGIKCVADLATANELDIERALYKALPFESEKEQDGELESDAARRTKIRTVFVTGKDGLTPREAAVMLLQEARVLLQKELGLQDVPWEQNGEEGSTHFTRDTNSSRSENVSAANELHSQKRQQIPADAQAQHDERAESSGQGAAVLIGNVADNEDEDIKNNINYGMTTIRRSAEMSSAVSNCSVEFSTFRTSDHSQEIDRRRHDERSVKDSKFSRKRASDNDSVVVEDMGKNAQASHQIKMNSATTTITKATGKRPRRSIVDKVNIAREVLENKCNDTAVKESSRNLSASSSPSLFDESFNLDTQICNVLEQNIIDSWHVSELEIPCPGQTTSSARNSSIGKQPPEQGGRNVVAHATGSIPLDGSSSKSLPVTWKDDSWDESRRLIEEIKQVGKKKTYAPRSTERVRSQNRKLKEIPVDASPVAAVTAFHGRRLSVDSNKSESDDIIVPSQTLDSPANSVKSRTRMKIESIRNMCTQKTAERNAENGKIVGQTGQAKTPLIKSGDDQATRIKPKLKDILANNKLLSTNSSTDSIISNSDEDEPLVKLRETQRAKADSRYADRNSNCKRAQSNTEVRVYARKMKKESNAATDWSTLNIIKVGSDRGTFNLFKRELTIRTSIALAIHCDAYMPENGAIGSKVVASATGERKKRSKRFDTYTHADKRVCGAAISWESNIAYYVSFDNTHEHKVPGREQLSLLKELLNNASLYVKCFATKEVYKTLYRCCGISATCRFLDPKTADWLLTGDVVERGFAETIAEYFADGHFIMERIGSCRDGGPGLNAKSAVPGEFRAAAEAVLTSRTMDVLSNRLEETSPTLAYTFREIEMRAVSVLARMELTGLGVSLKSLQELSAVILGEMSSLQERACALAGRNFNLASSKEVGQVLGLYNGRKRKVCTRKAVLEQCDNPISNLIVSWRKLSVTQTRIVYPLLNLAQRDSRIHGNCVTCTLTGRISMYEPNLQNVPKDFNSQDSSFVISVRMAFIPIIGNVMLSADYCQLELRILAHFSRDPVLCGIMQKDGDIFQQIAAEWNRVAVDQVDDRMRQDAKQLCYGMIYGMGVKTLAESLSVTEEEAKAFQESFMNAYPGIYQWLDRVTEEASREGRVTTLMGRRRMLPALSSTNPAEKSQAERQAVNTKVQGSAADITKKAMIDIDDRMRHEFFNSALVLPTQQAKRTLRSNSRDPQQRGGYLVLQLHDELLFEVNSADLREVAIIVKESMEQACQLAVPLPVKIKVGPAWGDLTEYRI